ncbi:MAG: 16S rRNA (cytosine(1402)-N(4))-methyltransferase RsmH, partial [Miltoncostaeaceae bacterium]
AHALLQGRFYVAAEDIRAVAKPVLRHRLITSFAAEADGVTTVSWDWNMEMGGLGAALFGKKITEMVGNDFATGLADLATQGTRANVVLMDLGLSSMQVDTAERGFSYSRQAPLDMRMDPALPVSAADLVNGADEADLARWFREYGDERHARQIARAIARRRAEQPIATTGDLVEIIRGAVPTPALFAGGHPAKRVFQALRIQVNDELGILERALPEAFGLLRPGGRLAVIAFQSLEDRMVKRFMRDRTRGCICPPDLPVCGCGQSPEGRMLTPKAVKAVTAEIAANPRAHSARLRVIRKADA